MSRRPKTSRPQARHYKRLAASSPFARYEEVKRELTAAASTAAEYEAACRRAAKLVGV